jgi:hypothetical protein
MLVGMGAEVMTILPQRSYDIGKLAVTIEIAGEEKGGFDIVLLEHAADEFTAVSKLVAGKDEMDFLLRSISSNDPAGLNIEQILRVLLKDRKDPDCQAAKDESNNLHGHFQGSKGRR